MRTRLSAVVGALLAVALLVAGCAEGPGFFAPPSAAAEGREIDALYVWVFIIAVGVFLIVEGLLLWIVLRYRRRPASPDDLPPQTHGNNFLEVLWTVIPALIVTGMFVATVDVLGRVQHLDAEPQGVVVDVEGFQWQWTFRYPNEGLAFTGAGEIGPVMVVPINERVRIRLQPPADVIHSFYVPMFRYKLDAIPGRVNEFDIVVEEPGTYAGQCAEFCGQLHYAMHFTVEGVTRAEYDAWVAEEQQAPEPTPSPPAEAPVIQVRSISVVDGFDPSTLSAPADSLWVVELVNVDPAVPHDFAIRQANPDRTDWQGDPDAQGGQTVVYQPPQLAAGTYEFYCSLHPNMVGTLNVGE